MARGPRDADPADGSCLRRFWDERSWQMEDEAADGWQSSVLMTWKGIEPRSG